MVIAVTAVTLTHLGSGRSSACAVAEPVPSLPSRLRSLGGFDQPQDPSDQRTLQAFAAQAAAAVAPGLIGAAPDGSVRVAAAVPGHPDALVVPLVSVPPSSPSHRVVAGLVSFLLDCAGRAYYSAVDDLTTRGASAPQSYPGVSFTAASDALGSAQPQLEYVQTPFAPRWRNRSTGATISAFAA